MPRFNAAWRLGVTATPRRKDGAQDVFFKHISPITYSAKTKMMRPKLRKILTVSVLKPISRGKYKVSIANLNSAQILNQLAADRFRTRAIVDDLVDAVINGRKIMVVSERLEHLKEMSEQLGTLLFNIEMPFVPKIDFYTGQWFSGEVWPKTKRNKKGKLLHRKGDPKFKSRTDEELEEAETANIIFATKQMVEEALDIPSLDVLVMATPIGDIEQAVGRVQRWCLAEPEKCERMCPWRAGACKQKPQPIVVDVVDENIPQLMPKYRKRMRFYKKEGAA
jgi:superfamily II DNA or RNA helicase